MIALGVAEIADRIRLEPDGWSMVVVDEQELDAITGELAEELAFLLEDEGAGAVRVLPANPPEPALVDEIARLAPEDVVVLALREHAIEGVARLLDYRRARLLGGPTGVILVSESSVQTLAAAAPSFWSWIGPRVWKLDLLAGRLDPQARLVSLRQGTGLTDAEVLQRAEAGTLPPDPVFAEWLVLLGRGDLLGR